MSSSPTFSLNVTLGYGADNKAEQELNKACPRQIFGLSDLASSFFDNNDQQKFFVASASEVRLIANPREKFWKTNTNLVIVFMPPQMISSAIKEHCSSNQVALGSSFWINPPSSANFANDLIPKIHPTALAGCRIRGIVLASIAATNAPAELLILEVPKGKSIQDDVLQITSGCTIVGDSDSGILKILPLATIDFNHEEEDGSQVSFSENDNSAESASSATKALQIPSCPVCIHRIDPFRFGLPRPRVQHLCSKFCPSPSSILEVACHKQNLLVSPIASSDWNFCFLWFAVVCFIISNDTLVRDVVVRRKNGRFRRDANLVKLLTIIGIIVIGSTAREMNCFASSVLCTRRYGHGKYEIAVLLLSYDDSPLSCRMSSHWIV